MSQPPDDAPRSEPPPAPDAEAAADIVAHLAATPMLANLAPASLAALAPLFSEETRGPGEVVARAGETDRQLRIVIEGALGVDRPDDDGALEHLGYLGYGDAVGGRGVFADLPRETSAMVLEPARFLVADREALWPALLADAAALDRLVLPDAVRRRLRSVERVLPAAEVEVALYRRHWLSLAGRLPFVVVVALASLVLFAVLSTLAASGTAIIAFALMAITIPVLVSIWSFLDYWHDCLIITNRRIVHIERTPFIDALRSEATLERIQDVQVVTPNLLARLLGFGNLTIETASTAGAIHFNQARDPERVRRVVFDQVDRARTLARRERQAWRARQVRLALGLEVEEAENDGPPGRAGSPGDDLAARADEDLPAFWLVVVTRAFDAATYFWPKMRVADDRVVTWRKHWWILLRTTWLPLILLIGAVGGLFAERVPVLAAWLRLPAALLDGRVVAVLALLATVCLAWLLWRFEDWRNDLYQLTDEHIIDIERMPLGFFEERRQASLSQIQDIRYLVPNPLASLLGFGNVVIKTAAESGSFTFDHVFRPESVQDEISTRMEEHRARREREEDARQAEEMKRWISAYHTVAEEARRGDRDGGNAREDGAPGEAGGGPEGS